MDLSPPPPAPASNHHLAALLADAYRDADQLRTELAAARKRADKAERIHSILHDAAASPSTNGTTTTPAPGTTEHPQAGGASPKQIPAEQLKRIVDEYEGRLAAVERQRDELEARTRELQEAWRQLDDFSTALELAAREARGAFARTRVDDPSPGLPFVLPPLPSWVLTASSAAGVYAGGMPPPSRGHVRSSSSRVPPVAFPLPPHPTPNPPAYGGSRRRRTPSMDGMYGQPPSKRSRASGDDPRGRELGAAYSESYITSLAHPHDREYQDQVRQAQQQQQQALLNRLHRPSSTAPPSAAAAAATPGAANPRIIDRAYGAYAQAAGPPHGAAAPARRGRSHERSHSRSGSRSSASSMDIDDMIIKATTGDEGSTAPLPANPTTNGRYTDMPPHMQLHPSQQQQQAHLGVQRRRTERDGVSPRGPGASPPAHPYPAAYGAGMRGPGVGPGVVGPGQGSGVVYTTHVFAPVVTGAPTKKSKFPNTLGTSASTPNLDTASPAQPATTTAPAVPFASMNAQGQRICRQCGMVGRYKDGKCVEKWGPGPMGPGTVCDRCRKKMKRVERRGTLDQQQQLASLAAVQAQQHQPIPRSGSHAQLPLSQSSDRSIHRSDTLLTNQSPHAGGTFREDSSIHTSSTHSQVGVRGPAVMLGAMPSPTPAKRQQPPPPSIAALRDDEDEDEDENDGADIPTSDVGRGLSDSRSASRNGRARPLDSTNNGGSKRSLLGGARSAHSISPRGDTDADGDADADAEAEAEILGAVDAADLDGEGEEGDADAEAELLEAVDAAEANSSSSHGERTWKDEPM